MIKQFSKIFFIVIFTIVFSYAKQECVDVVSDSVSCEGFVSHEIPEGTNYKVSKSVEKRLVVITASYNNEQWHAWNLDSIFSQKYDNWHLIYINDCSEDDTLELVKQYITENKRWHRVTLINNTKRKRALANLYHAIHSCNDTDVILILDGDDRFAHDQVLSHINNEYKDPNIWLTYGQFKEYPSGARGWWNRPMPSHVIENNSFREWGDTPSHLRTFYAGLFKRIKKEDLLHEGDFFPMTYDLAMMFPMIEMARYHFKFISEILVDYNAANSINDHKVSKGLQRQCDQIIRGRQRYDKVDKLLNDNLED